MSTVYELTLANGLKTKAVMDEEFFFGQESIQRYIPLWKVETGLCDFFFHPWKNDRLNSQGLNVTHVDGVGISEFVPKE